MQHGDAQLLGSTPQVCRAVPVYRIGTLGFGLGLIDRRIGCRVDDQLRPQVRNLALHGRSIGYIQLARTQANHVETVRRQAQQLVTHLTPGTGNQYPHRSHPTRIQ